MNNDKFFITVDPDIENQGQMISLNMRSQSEIFIYNQEI